MKKNKRHILNVCQKIYTLVLKLDDFTCNFDFSKIFKYWQNHIPAKIPSGIRYMYFISFTNITCIPSGLQIKHLPVAIIV